MRKLSKLMGIPEDVRGKELFLKICGYFWK